MDLFGKKAKKQLLELKKTAFDAQGLDYGLRNIVSSFNRNIAVYPTYNLKENSDRYITTDDVYSIVRMLAQTAAMVPMYAYEIKDDLAAKRLKNLTKPHNHPIQTKALQLKALVDLPETDPLFDLLEHPSDIYSKFEFFEAVFTSLFNDGNTLLLKERPGEGVNQGKPVNLLYLHPQCIVLKVTETLPKRIVAYDYKVDGYTVFENIPVEDVIHIKYFNPGVSSYGDELWGLSPIRVLAKRLTQLDGIIDVGTAQMQNGGVETIVYDEIAGDDPNVDVIGKRKDNFYKFLKNPGNAGAPYFASGKMGAISLGSSMRDLKVLESANITFKKLCNVFGTSDILFNSDSASTESNVQEMTKRTYTNTILPNVYRVRDALIKGLLPDFKGKKYDIREDISEITELQPNMKEMAETLDIAWWVTRNNALEMMHFERDPNPLFDKPLIPSGYQTLDDLILPDPVDTTLTDGNLGNGQ